MDDQEWLHLSFKKIPLAVCTLYSYHIMPRGGTIEKVTDQDLLVYFLLMEKKEKLNLSYMIVKYMWKNMTTNRKDAWRGEPRKNKREEKLKKLFL